MPEPTTRKNIFRRLAWVAGPVLFLLGVGWLHNRDAEDTRHEIEAECSLNPTGVWHSEVSDLGEQHSVDCTEWNRQADEADAYCMAHQDGVWESPPSETHRLVDCREWLQ
jgi:hypothetical protein